MAFLPREVGRDGRRTHRIVVGKPIPFSQLGQYDSDEAIVSHLRLRTYLLGKSYEKAAAPMCTKRTGRRRWPR